MKKINITKKLIEFYYHLSAADVDRTIFSAKFGDGKTEFLHQFKKEYRNEYTFYTLYPVNYQIAPNEQVMEYIKRDLLFQLILNGTLTPIDNIPDSILLQWYINEKSFNIVKDIIKFAPSILGSRNQFVAVLKGVTALVKGIKEQCKKFKEFKTKITEGDFEEAVNIIGNLSEGAGNIYELDPISWLIAQSIANKGGKSVLIIEDLDRIDPAHLFRILNIFSAHIDREYLCSEKKIFKAGEKIEFDTLPNKFGFDKIIFVMDAVTTREIFTKFYGNANYEGYISKFFSKCIFEYSITEYATKCLSAHIIKKYRIGWNEFIEILKEMHIDIQEKSVRDIAKVLNDFEDTYIKKVIQVADDFYFLSDTPLIRLLTIFRRLGVKKYSLNRIGFFLKSKYEKQNNHQAFLKLLGCFAMDKESILNNGKIYYNGIVYQMSFNETPNGFRTMKSIKILGDSEYTLKEDIPYLNIDKIFERALHYVM